MEATFEKVKLALLILAVAVLTGCQSFPCNCH
jgi:hypothetical protein